MHAVAASQHDHLLSHAPVAGALADAEHTHTHASGSYCTAVDPCLMGQLIRTKVCRACLADGAVWSHVAILVVVVGGGAMPLDAGEGGARHQHAGFTMKCWDALVPL